MTKIIKNLAVIIKNVETGLLTGFIVGLCLGIPLSFIALLWAISEPLK